MPVHALLVLPLLLMSTSVAQTDATGQTSSDSTVALGSGSGSGAVDSAAESIAQTIAVTTAQTTAQTTAEASTQNQDSSEAPAEEQGSGEADYTGPRWVLLRSMANDTQCLALPDSSPGPFERVVVKECACCDHSMVWLIQDGAAFIQPSTDTQPWCLDTGGEDNRVSVAQCDQDSPNQKWIYTGDEDMHLAIYEGSTCLDLKDGSAEGGGWLQTWQCIGGNTHQQWKAELEDMPGRTDSPSA